MTQPSREKLEEMLGFVVKSFDHYSAYADRSDEYRSKAVAAAQAAATLTSALQNYKEPKTAANGMKLKSPLEKSELKP